MRFPPGFIDRVKHHFPISEIVGARVSLRRKGREFEALCPFHKEKSPSFTVNDEKGFYHCFGCGAHGDAIGFLRETEGLTYKEAIEKLAEQAGIPLPVFTPQEQARAAREATLYDVMEAAARWFTANLASPQAREAGGYLRERGLPAATQSFFRLGYAPPERDALKKALLLKNISEAQMLEAGLLVQPEQGTSYDKFRGRIMFPIADAQGRVIAFGGRTLAKDAGPKYLNSPETPLFKKGENLYNYHLARKTAHTAKRVIVAEGYMDVIALYQAGFQEAVAPLGTAVTASQLQLLWRLADEPLLCFDGDTAGQRAMNRAGELSLPLLKPGKSLNFAMLPKGEDPDTLIRSQGVDAMRQLLSRHWPLSKVLWEAHAEDLSTPEKKAATEHKLMALTAGIADATVRGYYRSYFKEQLWARAKTKGKAAGSPLRSAHLANASPARASLLRGQKQMLSLILHYPPLLEHGAVEEAFARTDMADKTLGPLHEGLLEAAHSLEAMTAETLLPFLSARGLSERAFAIMADESVGLPRQLAEWVEHKDDQAIFQIWKRVFSQFSLLSLRTEYAQAVGETARSEEARLRCAELQRAIAQIEYEISQAGFSDNSGN